LAASKKGQIVIGQITEGCRHKAGTKAGFSRENAKKYGIYTFDFQYEIDCSEMKHWKEQGRKRTDNQATLLSKRGKVSH
jgi:hypothetical protein